MKNKARPTYTCHILILSLMLILSISCGKDSDMSDMEQTISEESDQAVGDGSENESDGEGTENSDEEENVDSGESPGVTYALENEGLVVMEAENTTYENTQWELRDVANPGKSGLFHSEETEDIEFNGVLEGFVGNGYLEYVGQDSFNEPKDDSMSYSFHISNAGTYYLWLRGFENHTYDPETENPNKFKGDRNNDAFIKMEGDYEANTNFEASYTGASYEDLSTYNKLYCSSGDKVPGWGRTRALEPEEFEDPIYKFKAGEIYTLHIVGRSNQFAIDRIYLVRLADENGVMEGDFIYPYREFRKDVDNGLYDESEYLID